MACPGFLHIMQRLFSQQRLCSSGFSLPSGPRMHLLTRVAGGLALLGPHGFACIGGLLSLWHASFRSSCLSQYRLSYHWVTSTSSHSESGLPSINSWSLSVRVCLRPRTYHVLVLTELQRICRTGTQGDRSLLNALSRKCYMRMLQYVHRETLP